MSKQFQFSPREEPFKSIRQMSRALRYYPDNQLRRHMTAVSRSAAQAIVPHVKAVTPVQTGTLKKNIKAGGTRTIPKIKAGTPKRGGPYAWMRHRGTKFMTGVPYMRIGISKGYQHARRVYIMGHKRSADIFNRSTARKLAKMKRIRHRNWERLI